MIMSGLTFSKSLLLLILISQSLADQRKNYIYKCLVSFTHLYQGLLEQETANSIDCVLFSPRGSRSIACTSRIVASSSHLL